MNKIQILHEVKRIFSKSAAFSLIINKHLNNPTIVNWTCARPFYEKLLNVNEICRK